MTSAPRYPSRPFEARYNSKHPCPRCDRRVLAGDWACFDGWGDLCHEHCVDPDPAPEPSPPDVCPKCFTALATNGACSCA